MGDHLRATSWYMPDTTLHELNGSCVVDISGMRQWLKGNVPWLSPEDAETFAASLLKAAALALEYQESDGSEDV